jgi:cyclophilin family peptidyl-prolyl cis-trans isomerase
MGLIFTLFGTLGCHRQPNKPQLASAAPSTALATGAAASAPALAAGARPASSGAARNIAERRRLAQRLAQQGTDATGSNETLVQLLRDEDVETARWAAFGLGMGCRGHEAQIVPALVTRAAALEFQPQPQPTWDQAMSWALSRCATTEAEYSLRAWLTAEGAAASDAALGLTRIAARRHALDESSLVSLLDAAAKPNHPVAAALLAIDPLNGLSASAATRLTDVAKGVLAANDARRSYAIAALVHGDERADGILAGIVSNASYSDSERAIAVRTLTRRAPEGPRALAAKLPDLASQFADSAKLGQSPWPVLLAALRNLTPEYSQKAQRTLRTWSGWHVEGAAPFIQHRVTQARCLSAAILADANSLSRALLDCDPQGVTGALVQLDVLDRAPIEGAHLKQWQGLLAAEQPRVRQTALRLLAGHRELEAAKILAQALRDAHPGTVAAAAQLLAAHPDRASRDDPKPGETQIDDQVVSALTAAFERQYAPDQGTVRGALSEAAAALQLLSLKSKIEAFCRDVSPAVRDKAARALVMLGDKSKNCSAPVLPPQAAPTTSGDKPVVIAFETSSGRHTITLRPDLAPRSVQRVLALVGEGFYNQMAVHRAVPGQVVQFGDPLGDGYGGSGRDPIVREPSPQHFAAFSVGMADWGKDTASSQLFITLCASPQLDGEYTWLGTASSSWEKVVLDDVILSARVE